MATSSWTRKPLDTPSTQLSVPGRAMTTTWTQAIARRMGTLWLLKMAGHQPRS